MRSADTDFGTKTEDVIDLCLQLPQRAVAFCLDEKTAIRAQGRRDPSMPLSNGGAGRHSLGYVRPRRRTTLLNTDAGDVIGKTPSGASAPSSSPSSARWSPGGHEIFQPNDGTRKPRSTEQRMISILSEAHARTIAEVAKHGVSEQTIYAWRRRIGALEAADVKGLRDPEAENSRLKKLLAERLLDIESQ